MQVLVVTIKGKMVAVCSSKDELIRMFGTTWEERVEVAAVTLNVCLV